MKPYERQTELMNILCRERHMTTANLASLLEVTERTIRNDITTLSLRYPIRTSTGRCGGVYLADWFHPHAKALSPKQKELLQRVRCLLSGEDLIVLNSIIFQFDSLDRLL